MPQALLLLKRSFLLASQNIIRNRYLSIATVSVIGIILFIFNLVISIQTAGEELIEKTSNQFDLIVYLSNETDSFHALNLVSELKEIQGIKQVSYRSKEEALEIMSAQNPQTIALIKENQIPNPFPADIRIITASIEQHSEIIDYLLKNHPEKIHPVLNTINQSQQLTKEQNAQNQIMISALSQRLANFITETRQIIYWTIIIFIFGAFLMISNAVSVSIFSRQKEIEIMELVGASYNTIRLPFIIETMILGLLAVGLSFGLSFISQSKIEFILNLKNQNLAQFFLLELVFTLILAISGSIYSVNRHLSR
jgi:cell division transport system permease protein